MNSDMIVKFRINFKHEHDKNGLLNKYRKIDKIK